MIKYLVALFLFASINSGAISDVSIYGTLMGYDNSNVRIKTSSGDIVTAPKKSLILPADGMIAGQAKVIARVSVNELAQLNPKFAAALKKK